MDARTTVDTRRVDTRTALMPGTDDYELVIGLETHVQLLTASKMFCGCAADYEGAAPNTRTCPVCLGLPGTLPVPNARAVELAARAALALGCTIHPATRFERKNYHYPDLPKGYQITQFTRPLATDGEVEIDGPGDGPGDGPAVRVRIERLHSEEDTGKLSHVPGGALIDFNRAGVPLVEIVTRPDLRTPEEAGAYVDTLRRLLRWIGVSTAVMAAGALRVDVNCSIRRRGAPELGTKVEIKNLNSIAAVRAALAYERRRQVALVAAGQPVAQETRGWLEDAGRTVSQRSKEQAHDYRYFPDPDLPPLVLGAAWIDGVRASLPELPAARRVRMGADHGLRADEARLLTRDRPTADYAEAAFAAHGGPARTVAQWITGPLFGLMNGQGLELPALAERIPPDHLADLVTLIDDGAITAQVGKTVLEGMLESGEDARTIVQREGRGQISEDAALTEIARAVIAAHPKAVADYRGGKQATLAFLIGGMMKATRGQADPEVARRVLLDALASEQPG
jgi:aspartyl-tRNA(Asn)/glutamyl-tRNA(Gln) amidotransferase subunit B